MARAMLWTCVAAAMTAISGVPAKGQSAPAALKVWPSDARLVNVKEKCGAKGDGATDDTTAIRKAFAENLNQHKTLLFPAGVYLISDTLEWQNDKKQYWPFVTMQGEGVDRTIIRLKDNCPGFGDPGKPKPMTRNGSNGQTDPSKGGNTAHNCYIMDMTFDVGKGNPGAVGADFTASNTGGVFDVKFVSGDGKGVAGLSMLREPGPLLVKRVSVEGFDYGIRIGSALYGIGLEDIALTNQNVAALTNNMNVVAVRHLKSVNKVPAFKGKNIILCLIDSELVGRDGQNAMELSGGAVIRNVKTSGYKNAIATTKEENKKEVPDKTIAGPNIDEFVNGEVRTLFDGSPKRTLNLPVEETPVFGEHDLNDWVSVESCGAIAGDKADDSAAVQKAIDSGKATVYFPSGRYTFAKPVVVRGKVRRIIGFNSWFEETAPTFRFENERPVVFERVNRPGTVEIAGSAPVAFEHIIGGQYVLKAPQAKVFFENVCAAHLQIGKGQAVYARQLNSEAWPPALVSNDGGTFWVLCHKTEFGTTVNQTTGGGRSEILGGLFYPSQGFQKGQQPIIVNDNSYVSASFNAISFGPQYDVAVKETRGSETKELKKSDLGRGTWIVIPLYAGAPAAK